MLFRGALWSIFLPPIVSAWQGHRWAQAQGKRSTALCPLKSAGDNPIAGMLRRGIAGLAGAAAAGSGVDDPAFSLGSLPESDSWEALAARLEKLQTPEERRFRSDLLAGVGPNSAKANLRLFESRDKKEEPRVVFYRDSASWCPYCHKVME